MIALLAVVGFRLFPAQGVTVLNDGRALQVRATFDPQAEALDAAAVQLEPGDQVLFATGGSHASLAIRRAKHVQVQTDGVVVALNTQAETVGGALAEAGVELLPGDRVLVNDQLTNSRGPLQAAIYALRATATGTSIGPSVGDTGADPVLITVRRARPVTVVVDTLRVETMSAADNVQGILRELGMTVREGDLVSPSLAQPLTAGMTIKLAKARTVQVTVDGEEHSLYTLAGTVAEVLGVLGLELGPEDSVSLPADTIVASGMSLAVQLTRRVEEEVSTSVAPPTVYETDASLAPGQVRVVAGREGVRVTKYLVTYKNGEVVSRQTIPGGGLVQEPVPTRHISGPAAPSKDTPVSTTIQAPEFTGTYSRALTVRATWYNATHGGKSPNQPAYGITASGIPLAKGICATDWSVIPKGTWMYIPGYGTCLAADVGGAIVGNHVDLGFPESAGSNPWRTQTLEIYILD